MVVSEERDNGQQKLNYIHMNCSFEWNTSEQHRHLTTLLLLLLHRGRHLSQELHLTLGDFSCLVIRKCQNVDASLVETYRLRMPRCRWSNTESVMAYLWAVIRVRCLGNCCFNSTTENICILDFFLQVSLNHNLPPLCWLSRHFLWNCKWKKNVLML